MLTQDEEHGEANKELFGTWLTKWVPRCLEATHALQPIWSQAAEKPVTFATSQENANSKFVSVLEDLGLDAPKELDQ